jgi:hypothetical protein
MGEREGAFDRWIAAEARAYLGEVGDKVVEADFHKHVRAKFDADPKVREIALASAVAAYMAGDPLLRSDPRRFRADRVLGRA